MFVDSDWTLAPCYSDSLLWKWPSAPLWTMGPHASTGATGTYTPPPNCFCLQWCVQKHPGWRTVKNCSSYHSAS